jgi:uncharacterized protein (DUF2252 family)
MPEQTVDNKPLPVEALVALGKRLRRKVPRSSHGAWAPAPYRPDPLTLLQAQDEGRLQHLLPIKYGRMLASPFAFLRGSAVVMASDLAATPVTGLDVILCGDAHLSNFGIFATPERNLVFDINDFDETYPGPWEWDLKRLATSAVVAGREHGFKEQDCRNLASVVSRSYRQAMKRFAKAVILDVWYHRLNADSVLEQFDKYAKTSAKDARKAVQKAETRTVERSLQKLTEIVDGKRQFVSDPPLLERLSDVVLEVRGQHFTRQNVEDTWLSYVNGLPEERRRLLARFRVTDAALRVGGVGSVGTRCTIVLLEGHAEHDVMILQQKEAGPSALEPYLPKQEFASQAQRVVVGQHLIQAASDIFLGWNQGALTGTEYYWRQLTDKKGSFDTQKLDERGLTTYLAVCSACLARAHARTGDAAAISGYLGSGEVFDSAISDFSVAYADQTARDHQALVDAVNKGEIVAETGI